MEAPSNWLLVHYNAGSLYQGSFSLYFTTGISGVKKIVHYTEDFIIQRFVILRFHCIVTGLREQTFFYIHSTTIWKSSF